MEIPIKNIYYILSYAWKYFKFNDISAIDKKDFQTTTEFFGELFDLSFTRYIKKGLQRDYITYNEELKTIKSKIDFGTTLKKVGFKSKKFHCIYDEYTINNLTNQVIKSTAFLLIKSEIRLNVLVKSNLIYNTIIVIPTDEQLLKWKSFEKEEFINKDYPIASLENLDTSISQQCLIKIKAQDMEVGLCCLRSWGFNYNDILIPNQPKKGLASMPLEYILLKGTKGKATVVNSFIKSNNTFDLINYAEKIGVKPFLLVGEVTSVKEWVYCVG